MFVYCVVCVVRVFIVLIHLIVLLFVSTSAPTSAVQVAVTQMMGGGLPPFNY